jgi:hypothetical protein
LYEIKIEDMSFKNFNPLILIVLLFSFKPLFGQNLKNCKIITQVVNEDVTVSIDPRIEFFQIFNFIGGNPGINTIDTDYKEKIIDYFKDYSAHPSLQYYRNNHQNFFTSIDAPYPFLLSLNNDFSFASQVISNEWPHHPEIDTLLSAFKEFAEDTDFASFFNSQQNYYDLLLENTTYIISDFDEKNRMLDYYGSSRSGHDFGLVLNVLGMGNFGIGLKAKTSDEHYAVVSPGKSISGIPIYSKKELESLIWHEFGHSFTNPLIDKYWKDLEDLEHLLSSISESMSQQAYRSWRTVLYEHLTRALTCRFSADKYGELYTSLNQEKIELGRRFIYVKPIIEALKDYEKNRERYPTLDSFMPRIIERLKGLSENDIRELLAQVDVARKPTTDDIPENSDFFDRQNQLIILASGEKDTISDKELKAYISKIYPEIPTMIDTLAINTDLSDYSLFVIGTYNGNKFIEENIDSLPIHMDSNKLIADKIYEGTGYAFMTGWPNPQNSTNVMTLYIAQNPKDLINFTWVRRGGTDYHIMKNLITLKADDYQQYMKVWLFE